MTVSKEPGSVGHRKVPRQARSKLTVRTIYDAAVQIIQGEGSERLTTNRISEVSGFSVGTLYQYFRNKEELLLSMASAERDQMLKAIDILFDGALDRPLEETVRELVQLTTRFFFKRHKVRQLVIRVAIQHGAAMRMLELMTVAQRRIGEHLAGLEAVGGRPLSPAARLVASSSLIGSLRAAVMENSPLIGTQELEDELVRLLLCQVKA